MTSPEPTPLGTAHPALRALRSARRDLDVAIDILDQLEPETLQHRLAVRAWTDVRRLIRALATGSDEGLVDDEVPVARIRTSQDRKLQRARGA
jgi:hypothetical protein